MATLDDILGAAPAQAPAKVQTLDDILGPQSRVENGPASTGEAVANYIANSPVGHILDAFGQGVDQGLGTEPLISPEAEKAVRASGFWNDYEKGQTGIIRGINETVFRPAATAFQAALRGGTALFTGAQGAVYQAGKELGAPRLARDIAAIPEAFMGTPHPLGVPDVAQARSLGVIGEGEAGWKGTAEQTAAFEEARKRFAPSQDIAEAKEAAQETGAPAAEPQPGAPQAAPPDIHATARQIDPDTFREYDALAQRKETFARWIDELGNSRDEAATADLDKQIAEQKARLEDATGKKAATYQNRIDDLTDQRDQALEDARAKDSPDMARIRQQLQQTDYRMRDIAPDVTKAYQRARNAMPTEQGAPEAVAPSEPTAPVAAEPQAAPTPAPEETAPAATPVAPVAAQKAHVDIAADVTQKLTAAGRPAEEANAAAAIVQAHYEARAARFNGAKGSGADLYRAEGPEIRAANQNRARVKEAAQSGRTLEQPAYHGSPHIFDRFDVSKIGTGEGAKAYGHGLYFAGRKGVAEYYRDKLSRTPGATSYEGKTILNSRGTPLVMNEDWRADVQGLLQHGVDNGMTLANVLKQARDEKANAGFIRKLFGAGYDDRILNFLEKNGATIGEAKKGRLYHVEIAPTNAELLDWDKPISEQSEKVKAALEKVPRLMDYVREQGLESAPAGSLYKSGVIGGSPKLASDRLLDAGVRGIRYLDQGSRRAGEGSHNFVIFSHDDVAIKEFEQAARGKIALKDGRAIITLFKNADASTFMHETGHLWLEELMRDASDQGAPADLIKDATTVRDWLGAKEGEFTTRQHEKFARGFERYLMEGRAPTKALAGVFGQFKDWLTKIYQTVAKLRSPITDDIRDVFDRLIAKNPDRDTVVAPEREAPKSVVARHNELAETTPPDQARLVAEQVKAETDRILSAKAPEIADEVAGRKSGTSGGKGPGAEADGDRPPPGPDTGATGGGAGRRGIDAGGSEAAPQGAGGGTAVAERIRTEPPAGPHDALPEPQSRLVDRAGNIRLDNLNTPADISAVIRETADRNGGFIGARRGVISDAQVLDLADALGVNATPLLKRKVGQAFNAEQVVQARKLLIQSATDLRDAAGKAAEGGDQDAIAFAKMLDRHRMIQEQVSGVTAEAGRALRAFRALEGAKGAAEVSGLVSEMTGRTLFQIRQTAARMAQLDTTAKVSKFAHDSGRSGVFDWLQSLFINALISGPFTHAGYTAAGELYGLFRATAETGASALVGKVRQLTGLGEAERAHISEMPAQLYGMYSGAKSGLKASWQAWKANQAVLPSDVLRVQNENPKLQVAGQSTAPHSVIPNPEIAGVKVPVGTVIGSPGRLVAALHSFNWTTFYTQSVAGQASRLAEAAGLKGSAFVDHIVQLTQKPTDAMIKEAIMDANSGALLQRPAYDSLMGMVSRLTNYGIQVPDVPLPGGKSIPMGTLRPLKYIDPFVQIQANIQRTAFGRGTPLALFSNEVRDNLAMKNGGAAFDRQAGRLLAGTSFMIAAGSLAAEGLMNWSGPDDRNEQARFQKLHGLPHGLRIGDFSYDMLRLGNLGLQMSVAADLYHAGDRLGKDDIAKVGSDLVHAFSQNIIDESSLHGPSQLLRAVEEHDRYGASYVRQFLTSFMPFSVGLSQVARQVDPYSRQARTTMDAFKAKLPVVSEGLEPRYDIWGQPVLNRGWALTYYQRVTNDPVDRAFERVGEQLGVKFYPSPVEPKIRGVTLTDHQYADYSRIAGRMAKMRLDQIVQQPGFETLPAQTQHDMMAQTVTSARETARSLIMMQNPNIITDATKAKVARLTGAK